jgi:RNA polymerase sigma-70 factor (sigma-E family)
MGWQAESRYASFTVFVAARQHALLRAAYLVAGDRVLAEDLLQEALTKLALRWDRVGGGNPEAFVRTVLYRDLVSWRRKHRRERLVDSPERAGPDDSAPVDLRMSLRVGLARLTPRQRAVLVLRFYEDLSEGQTAQVLDVTVGTVKSQTHAALRRLREAAPELRELLTEDVR